MDLALPHPSLLVYTPLPTLTSGPHSRLKLTATQCLTLRVTLAGTVMVTFKSRYSLPPYRIENACSDVVCWFAQVTCRLRRDHPGS